MANTNTFTAVTDSIFARALMTLRENSVMPRMVNRRYDTAPGDRFDTINVPIPTAVAAQAVTPSYVAPDDAGITPTSVAISLDQWYESAIFVTDKQLQEIADGVQEEQFQELVKALANQVDSNILSHYTGVYGYAGVAGTTPFSTDLSELAAARKNLQTQLAPKAPRYAVVDESAEENLVQLRAAQDASWRPSQGPSTLQEGDMGRILGVDFAMDQNVPTHTAGDAAGATVDTAAYAVGATTLTLASAGTGAILAGDVITLAGDSQTYAVVTGDADVSGGGTVVISPGLQTAIATSASPAITVKASHTVNLVFHRDAFALAARPPVGNFMGADARIRSIMDPVSGLSLTLEISRQHYRWRIAVSSLWGSQLVRKEFATRLAG